MQLIGITGAIGSGKTALASALAKAQANHAIYETSHLVAEVADAFNQALKAELAFATARNDIELINQALIWLPDTIEDRLKHDVSWSRLAIKRHATLVHPALYGKLLSYVRTVREQPKILGKQITTANMSDYRQLLQWLHGYLAAKARKTIWYDELLRRIKAKDSKKDLVIICGVRYPTDAALVRANGGKVIAIRRPGTGIRNRDLTEISRKVILPDTTVLNTADLKKLHSLAELLLADISSGKVKPYYRPI